MEVDYAATGSALFLGTLLNPCRTLLAPANRTDPTSRHHRGHRALSTAVLIFVVEAGLPH